MWDDNVMVAGLFGHNASLLSIRSGYIYQVSSRNTITGFLLVPVFDFGHDLCNMPSLRIT